MGTKQETLRQKKKARQRQRKAVRVTAPARWRLDVYLGGWRVGFRKFKKWREVESHLEKTERCRKAGQEIAEGRIVEIKTGAIVKMIKHSPVKVFGKGAFLDKMAMLPGLDKMARFLR